VARRMSETGKSPDECSEASLKPSSFFFKGKVMDTLLYQLSRLSFLDRVIPDVDGWNRGFLTFKYDQFRCFVCLEGVGMELWDKVESLPFLTDHSIYDWLRFKRFVFNCNKELFCTVGEDYISWEIRNSHGVYIASIEEILMKLPDDIKEEILLNLDILTV